MCGKRIESQSRITHNPQLSSIRIIITTERRTFEVHTKTKVRSGGKALRDEVELPKNSEYSHNRYYNRVKEIKIRTKL